MERTQTAIAKTSLTSAHRIFSRRSRVVCSVQTSHQLLDHMNIRVLRDIAARNGVKNNEALRRAYLYVARNERLPPAVRYQAQLQLNSFGRYTRPTTVKNRCIESGRGRGIISEFRMCRVSHSSCVSERSSWFSSSNSVSKPSIMNYPAYEKHLGSYSTTPYLCLFELGQSC